MVKCISIAVLLAAALHLLLLSGEIQAQSSRSISPPDGTTVETLPATFHCLIMENNEPVSVEWLIDSLPLNHGFITEGLQPNLMISGDSRENITINGFSPLEIPPPSLLITCRQSPPGESYANFTLIVPPPIVLLVRFRSNVTAAEGDTATLCVDVEHVNRDIPSPPFNVTVEVLPNSTAEASTDYESSDIPMSLSFMGAPGSQTQCFNVSILVDGNTKEDVEMLQIQLTNTTSPNVLVGQDNKTAIITIPCSERAVRLVGGVDSAQGRVEICHLGEWGTVCTNTWDMPDARVVCRQFGFSGVPSAYTNLFGVSFGRGDSPVLGGVQCMGDEDNLLNCSSSGLGEQECSQHDAGVDCAGRGEPRFNFENVNTPTTLAEGRSAEVCVELVSGVISVPIEVRVETGETSAAAQFPADFLFNPPPSSPQNGIVHLLFSPSDRRKCLTVTGVVDMLSEATENIALMLITMDRSAGTKRLTLLDTDIECTNGSVCVDLQEMNVFCVPEQSVCDGCMDCPDNSDEANCPDICPPGMFKCCPENTCLSLSQMCDSYPDCVGRVNGDMISEGVISLDELDCPVGCTSGDVDLVVGVTSAEGAVRVCIDNRYIPLSTLGLSVLEASLICQKLGRGQAGYPTSSMDEYFFQLVSPRSYLATISCPDSASSFSQCTIGNTTQTETRAAVICIDSVSCPDGKVRLSGPSEREGRVEVCYRGVWGAVMDGDWSNRDAAVVCRELGFPSQGALPVQGAVYTYNEPVAFVAESITCVGNESALADCPSPSPLGRLSGIPSTVNPFTVAGVRCDDYRPGGCTDLEVRLTYRDATGHSGQFEVCQNETWRRTCDSTFFLGEADAACNQLFGPSQAGQFPIQYNQTVPVLSDTVPVFTDVLLCEPGQPSLNSCSTPSPSSSDCPLERQPTVRCRSLPVMYVSPELPNRMYTVEAGHLPPIQCQADTRTIPPTSSAIGVISPMVPGELIEPRRRSIKRAVESSSPPQSVFLRRPATESSPSGEYTCRTSNFAGMEIRETLSIQVLAGEGQPDFAFLQFSILNSTRYSTIPDFLDFDFIPRILDEFVVQQIYERTPGVQRVNCGFIDRRPFDVERGFDRIACQILHFNRSDETEVTTAAAIAGRLARQLPLVVPYTADFEVTEYPEVAFTSPSSTGAEGDVLTICLAVVSGEIATPTNVTLTTLSFLPGSGGIIIDGGQATANTRAVYGLDYNTTAPYMRAGEVDITLTVTFEPGQMQSCFDINIVDDNQTEPLLKSVTFSYFSSSPSVARVNLVHEVFILDNDLDCETEVGPGSRLCVDIPARNVTCLDPALVCDYQVVDCPDMSDELNCPSPLENIVNQTVTDESVSNISAVVSSFAADSVNFTFLQTSEFLTDISMVFGSIAGFVNTSNTTVNSTVVEDLAVTLNSLTQWQSASLMVSSTSMIVESFEIVITVFAQEDNFTLALTDVTIIAELGTTEMFMATGRTMDFSGQAGVPATIDLPPSLFNNVPADRPVIGVFFALYENPALLPATMVTDNETFAETAVGSPIVAATVGPGINFVNLDPPVTITLGLLPFTNNVSTNLQTARCASWDFLIDDWVTDGCTTRIIGPTDFICECTHLTNFAILIDICRRAQECESNPVVDQVLSYITYIGVAVSCVGLIITVITLLVFKKLRERDNSKYHIQLSVALFCMLVVFVFGIGAVDVYGGCIVVSILIHYFSLVSVMWMGAEALLMFQKLVIVFMRITKKFLIILSLVCWLVPLIPVLIPMIVDLADGTDSDTDLIITRNYNSTTNTLSGFCFHKHPGVFFGAFLVPILLVILFNLVIFIWVVVILVRHTRGQMKRSKEGMKPKTALRLTLSISGIMFLFGLTWLFAAFTFTIAGNDVLRIIFQALFTVFASFQGFFIFLFFCVLNKEARESWRELLSCGRYKSELLHPSQYKNTSSAGSGPTKRKLKTGSTEFTSAYSTSAIPRSTEPSPLPEKRDLGKAEEGIHTEIPLKSSNGTDESTVKESSAVEAESKIDSEDDKKAQKWLEAEPVKKARVKRYSTKKVAKHHIEEYEVDFEEEESEEEQPEI